MDLDNPANSRFVLRLGQEFHKLLGRNSADSELCPRRRIDAGGNHRDGKRDSGDGRRSQSRDEQGT
jgi:hypothetical protein